MTDIRRYSIAAKYSKEVQRALDTWRQRGLSESAKICQGIIKLHEEEEEATKITQYTGQQSNLQLLPPAWQMWTVQHVSILSNDDILSLMKSMMENLALLKTQLAVINSLR